MPRKIRVDVVRSRYLLFTNTNKVGGRLEEARLLHQLRCGNYNINRKKWCETICVGSQAYAGVVEGQNPVPMVVWTRLYELGFSLDWFASGIAHPFRDGPDGIMRSVLDPELGTRIPTEAAAMTQRILEPLAMNAPVGTRMAP